MRRIAIWLFIFGATIRALVAIIRVMYGLQNSGLPMLPFWNDYDVYYIHQLSELASGLFPYRDIPYSYTPLFLYGLYPFYKWGGVYAPSIPILAADAATGSVIYLLIRRKASEHIALLGGLAYSILPFALIYEGYLWLSSQPMTFFMLLSLYLASKDSRFSAVSVGIAGLFKQEALFMFVGYLLGFIRVGRKTIVRVVAYLLATLFVGSLPFLLAIPQTYVNAVSYGLLSLGSHNPVGNISGGITTGLSNQAVSDSSRCATVVLTLIGTHTGCSYSFVIYPNTIVSYTLVFLDQLSKWTLIPLLILSGIALYASRTELYFEELAGAYSILIFLSFFSYAINSMHRYYLIPVYALLLASSTNKKSLAVGFTLSTLSLITAVGSFQIFLPTFGILLILAQEDPLSYGRMKSPEARAVSRETHGYQ